MENARLARAAMRQVLPQVLHHVERSWRAAPGLRDSGMLNGTGLVEVGAELAYTCARQDRLVEDAEAFAPFARSGRLHAEHGSTAAELRLGVRTAQVTGLRAALASCTPAHQMALMPLVSWVARLGPMYERAELTAFLNWHRGNSSQRIARREMARALLAGSLPPGAGPAGTFRLDLVQPVDDERHTTLARLDDELAEANVLCLPRKGFLAILQPADRLPLLPAGCRSVFAHAPGAGLRAAYREALGVLRLVQRLGLPPGSYDLLSVAGEHLVATGAPATVRRLRELVQPLADPPELLTTLHA